MDVTASFPRRKTRRIMVGSVPVGGGAPITVPAGADADDVVDAEFTEVDDDKKKSA